MRIWGMTSESHVQLSPEDRAELEGFVAGRNAPQKLVWRARIVLMWAAGAGITKIVRATGKTERTAYRWRDRYIERGVEGLRRDASRPGRKKPLDAATIARVVRMTLHDKPPAATHWSARKLARAVGVSHTSVQRIWAALNTWDGKVIGTCMPRHRHREFLCFLKLTDQKTPASLDLHRIVDNDATHKTPAMKRWLKAHPRFHLHFTPASASWLDMVERFFAEITRNRIRRGAFKNVAELKNAIME